MGIRARWLWVATIGTLTSVMFTGVVGYRLFQDFSTEGRLPSTVRLAMCVTTALACATVGLVLTRRAEAKVGQVLALIINACVFPVFLLLFIVQSAFFLGTTKQRYLIPKDYQGDVVIIHNVPTGTAPERTHWEVTYRIPPSGVLEVQDRQHTGLYRMEYDFVSPDGRIESVPYVWASAIPETPENLADDRDIGVYVPSEGASQEQAGCIIDYEQFYVGTKAAVLKNYKERDFSEYARQHPEVCVHPSN